LGPLFDKELLKEMSPEGTARERKCTKTLDIWRNEIDSVPFLYDMSELSSFTKLSPPNLDLLIEKMNELGPTSKTHFSPTSFVTELPLKDVLAVYREIGHETPPPVKPQ
jgi:tRNA (guanine26-N2/guanine27-N2)-dimethyltransferase